MTNLSEEKCSALIQEAKSLRKEVLDLTVEQGYAHIGGDLSQIEIILSLYNGVMKPEDKFILSKGHACSPLYCILRKRGFNPTISAHPDIDPENGISCTSGSLGHGLPIAAGISFAKKLNKDRGQIYVLLGDGECQEGTLWEASLIASRYKLDNLTAIIDYNKIQGSGRIEEILPLPHNFRTVLGDLGWYTLEIDGHSFSEIIPALQRQIEGKPKLIIAHTIKGKGISFMENNPSYHGWSPRKDQLNQAYRELE